MKLFDICLVEKLFSSPKTCWSMLQECWCFTTFQTLELLLFSWIFGKQSITLNNSFANFYIFMAFIGHYVGCEFASEASIPYSLRTGTFCVQVLLSCSFKAKWTLSFVPNISEKRKIKFLHIVHKDLCLFIKWLAAFNVDFSIHFNWWNLM